MKKAPTIKEIERARTKSGGWTKEQLMEWGVSWPPRKGWKKALAKGLALQMRRVAAKPKKAKQAPPRRKDRDVVADFYRSIEWKQLRYDALKAGKGRCECCGVGPNEGAILNVDHIKPVSRYWHLRLVLANLQVLCGGCNAGKGVRDQTDWRKERPPPIIWSDATTWDDLDGVGLIAPVN